MTRRRAPHPFGEWLTQQREAAGYQHQKDLAAALQVSAGTVSRWHSGGGIDPEHQAELAEKLQISVETLREAIAHYVRGVPTAELRSSANVSLAQLLSGLPEKQEDEWMRDALGFLARTLADIGTLLPEDVADLTAAVGRIQARRQAGRRIQHPQPRRSGP